LILSEELALGVFQHFSGVCEYHGIDASPENVATLLAMCSGFSLGACAPGRELIPDMAAKLSAALTLGVGDGMAVNRYLPRLNG
jgi:hypothetical protein